MRRQLKILARAGEESKALSMVMTYFADRHMEVFDISFGGIKEFTEIYKEPPRVFREITITYFSLGVKEIEETIIYGYGIKKYIKSFEVRNVE